MAMNDIYAVAIANRSVLLAGLICVYLATLSIYRLYFHPLAKFPGPKLAALSVWYAGYHDLVRGGQYVWVVEEMHRKYGPIVRVRPDALHVNDPAFIDQLYSQSPKQRRERYRTVLQPIQAPGSILATKDHDIHRKRRSVLNPYFSKQNVRRLEPVINETLDALLLCMKGWSKSEKPVSLNSAFRAATQDIIQSYAFGKGDRCLDKDDCNAGFFEVMTPQRVCYLGLYAFWVARILENVPPAILTTLVPRVALFIRFVEGLIAQINAIKQEKQDPTQQQGRTIFHEIIQSDIPESEKQTSRLADEAMVLAIAGSETTASTLAGLTYHLLSDPKLLTRLKEELETAMPDPNTTPSANKLEALPFLNALIQETLRLYPGATHRQDRTAPDEILTLTTTDPSGRPITHTIPPNTAVGMTAPIINRHPSLYDLPDTFDPDRYLTNPKLTRYLFTFSKGTRQCIGMNLAHQELLTLTAGIFRKYGVYDERKDVQDGPTLHLLETRLEDVKMHADYITPAPRPGSLGLRVVIRE